MNRARGRDTVLAMLFWGGAVVFQGCPVSGAGSHMVSDCFGEDTISASEYDDLNPLEQLLYEENDCGRYEPQSSLLDDIL